jgi:hypothetical protein
MVAPRGNQFWKQRSSHGRRPKFETPEILWDACCEYFEWVDKNPILEVLPFAYQGRVKLNQIPKMRAMTVAGLCIFLDISVQAWTEYRRREGFGEVTTRVDEIIRTQKFQGAAAGLLNPNIIARDLGLADRSELTGKDGAALRVDGEVTVRSRDQLDLARRIAFLLAKGAAASRDAGVKALTTRKDTEDDVTAD